MRRNRILGLLLATACLTSVGPNAAQAQCSLPNQLTNGTMADATQVMANFNALVACLNSAGPAGSTDAIQYNAGAGNLGGVGPLSNGQLVIGSTGNAPQAQTLTAGPGISITNGPGSVTIGSTGSSGGAGLYSQIMSATPTSAGTGLTNWLNQGNAVVSDSPIGIVINAPAGGNANMSGRYMAAPSPPYKITALAAVTRDSNNFTSFLLGWYDGSSKLHALGYLTQGAGVPFLNIEKWNSPTSFNANDFNSNNNAFSQPIWLQLQDDGTNVSFAFSQDGANFLTLFSIAKSSGWLGASGYNNVFFGTNPSAGPTIATVMSWTKS